MSNLTNDKFPDLGEIFLWALELPDYARPEYFIKAQQQSEWSKAVFLKTLYNEFHHYEEVWQVHANKERFDLKKKRLKLPDDFGIDLEKETKGKQKGKLTRKLLEDLRFAVERAYKWEVPEPEFDSLQVIAFCERLLQFVKGEYEDQIKPNHSVDFYAERLKKKGHQIEGKPTHVVYSYNVITDVPVASYYRFKTEVRKLLLNTQNPEALSTILKPVRDLAIKIVELWNNDLQPLDQPMEEKDRNRAVREQRLITLNHWDLSIWHRNVQYDDEYYREPNYHFMNRDFAVFAANVANLIGYEVLKIKKTAKNISTIKREYKDLDELFIEPEMAVRCYAILEEDELIGPNHNFIRGPKSAFCLWAKELLRSDILHFVRDDELTMLMNRKFTGLDMGASTFRSSMTRVIKDFRPTFRRAIAKLKQI